jgi:dipeptidase D
VEFETPPGGFVPIGLSVSGLRGGHSGLDIDRGRGNALKLLARVLRALEHHGARLARIDGGNKRNAIPRDAHATLYVENASSARNLIDEWNRTLRSEFATTEPDILVAMGAPSAEGKRVLREPDQRRIVQALIALPHGVIKMSPDIPTLVETSTNLAVVATDGNAITIATSQRSSVGSEIDEIVDTVTAIFALAGARVEHSDGYPGWKPNLESPILQTASATYYSLYGKTPEVKAVHAGLECGIIGEKYPGIDMISFGPTLEGVHSPDEKIYIDTVPRFWEFLLAILKATSSAAE